MPEQDPAAPAAKKTTPAKTAAKKATPSKKADRKPAKKTTPPQPVEPVTATPPPDEAPPQHFEDSKVAVQLADSEGASRKAAEIAAKESAALRRAEHVEALETELAFLQRQPNPNKGRVDEVKKQIDAYSKAPKNAPLETA